MISRLGIPGLLSVLASILALVTAPDPAPAVDGPDRVLDRAAQRLDRLVEAKLRAEGLSPHPVVDDATFVRRAYVDIVGRIPTAAETREFLDSASSDKRAALVDELIESPGHASHQFNWLADLLRVKGRLRRVSGEPFMHYLKESLAENKPYDQMVAEMLSADGPAHERGNGATGYYLRDNEMPQDNMANTMRVFLGTRIECAQCHDHPFDTWTQKQFFELAAFTGGMTYRNTDAAREDGSGRRILKVANQVRKKHGRQGFGYFRNRVLRPLSVGISGSGTGLVRLPHDYQYDDAKPGTVVTAQAPFGPAPELAVRIPPEPRKSRRRSRRPNNKRRNRAVRAPQIGSRSAFAEWVTSPENPRFTNVIANRLWKQVMGEGVIEPVDDLREDTVAANPALMTALEDLMVEGNFDMRRFLRVLFRTKTYQREAFTDGETAYHFQGPRLRRLTAEQTWDSLLTFVVDDVDASLSKPVGPRAEAVYRRTERVLAMSEEELLALADDLMLRRSNPGKYREMQRKERRERQRKARAQRAKLRPLYRELVRARRVGDRKKVEEIERRLAQKGFPVGRVRNFGGGGQLIRASDLPQPAPDGHFLRDFGQSDRDQIASSHTDPNVPQVLALMNGFVERRVLGNRQSALWRELELERGVDARIDHAYLAVLNRQPTFGERSLWRADVRRLGESAYKDLVWTLVNSHEFLFLR